MHVIEKAPSFCHFRTQISINQRLDLLRKHDRTYILIRIRDINVWYQYVILLRNYDTTQKYAAFFWLMQHISANRSPYNLTKTWKLWRTILYPKVTNQHVIWHNVLEICAANSASFKLMFLSWITNKSVILNLQSWRQTVIYVRLVARKAIAWLCVTGAWECEILAFWNNSSSVLPMLFRKNAPTKGGTLW